MGETERRRTKQQGYNKEHNITPVTIKKKILEGLGDMFDGSLGAKKLTNEPTLAQRFEALSKQPNKIQKEIEKLRKQMKKAADNLDFETAAKTRDDIKRLQILELNARGDGAPAGVSTGTES